ncbi:MAG: undecaprenyl/decaprenyl-phosphate alpha-N-acetylglucosaminyl 1-phosphate transferase [Planctomycetes bacterium]|nr:undecaprenyl/decaprenyl-phosphate alpha-N-acetylglucosaminyl 1-phosphate transferase [Planctomycetota bacterium]
MRPVLTLAFCGVFAASAVLVLTVRRYARKWGVMDHPGGRKIHPNAVALGGGVAIFLASAIPLFLVGAACRALVAWPDLLSIPPALHRYVQGAASQFSLLCYILAGGLAIAVLGLWDDLKGLNPPLKLLGQFIIAGGIAAVPGVRITIFVGIAWVHILVTAVWIVALINGFNLLDNMDGQCGLVAFLTGGALLALALQTGQMFIAGLLLVLMGAVLGFLVFNFPPASIFMGDSGSMYVGYVLAVATILTSFLTSRQVNPFFPLLVPLVIFAIPLYDTASVILIRLHKGHPLMQGDRNHLAHRLLRLGLSERMVLLAIGLMVLATAPGATIPYGSSTWQVFVPAIQAAAVLCVIVILEVASVRGRRENVEN